MALEIVAPVVGLPVGPATEATVKEQLNIGPTDHNDDAAIALAINATNALVVSFPYVDHWSTVMLETLEQDDPPAVAWPYDITAGATMLAARLFRRRNSTEGVVTLGEQGAVYVQRNDPDVALLLRLGNNRQPAVG